MVCRSWHGSLPNGVQECEIDMHPEQEHWGHKVEALKRLMPRLRSCTMHIGHGATDDQTGEHTPFRYRPSRPPLA